MDIELLQLADYSIMTGVNIEFLKNGDAIEGIRFEGITPPLHIIKNIFHGVMRSTENSLLFFDDVDIADKWANEGE